MADDRRKSQPIKPTKTSRAEYDRILKNQKDLAAAMGTTTNTSNQEPFYLKYLEGILQNQFLEKNPELKIKPNQNLSDEQTRSALMKNYADFSIYQKNLVDKWNRENPEYSNPNLRKFAYQKFLEDSIDYSKIDKEMLGLIDGLKKRYVSTIQAPSQAGAANQMYAGGTPNFNEAMPSGAMAQSRDQNAQDIYNQLMQQQMANYQAQSQAPGSGFGGGLNINQLKTSGTSQYPAPMPVPVQPPPPYVPGYNPNVNPSFGGKQGGQKRQIGGGFQPPIQAF